MASMDELLQKIASATYGRENPSKRQTAKLSENNQPIYPCLRCGKQGIDGLRSLIISLVRFYGFSYP